MDFTPDQRRKAGKWMFGIAAACILLYLGIQNIGTVARALGWCLDLVMPLVLGGVIAMILNVPMRFFEDHIWKRTRSLFLQKIRRPVCLVLALVSIIGIMAGVVWLVIPELADALTVVIQGIGEVINMVNAMSEEELAELPLGHFLLSVDWERILGTIQSWLKTEVSVIVNTAFGTVTSFVGGLFDFFIAFVFSVYILFGKERLIHQAIRLVRAWLPEGFGEWLLHAASVANSNFRNFISGQSLEAVILGVLCMLGMLILGIPYAPMVGSLVGVTALIPVVGAFIGVFVGAFMILTADPFKAVEFVIFFLVLQQLEGNLIYPRVMGSRVNLPGIWVLTAVTVGGGIGGPVGMLLSIPVTSTVFVLLKEATRKREIRRNGENPEQIEPKAPK